MAYIILTATIRCSKDDTLNIHVQIILYMVFSLQQIQLATFYQPLTKQTKQEQLSPYLSACGTQLIAFVCLVMTPSIPFKKFIFPVAIIYSLGFWVVYYEAPGAKNDVNFYKAVIKFMTPALISVSVGYFHQVLILNA